MTSEMALTLEIHDMRDCVVMSCWRFALMRHRMASGKNMVSPRYTELGFLLVAKSDASCSLTVCFVIAMKLSSPKCW